jgi:hypothetical protein
MAEDKKVFLQGKMNLDIDSRLLPNGEYRQAQNIQITTSENSDVGTIQNVLGNSLVSMDQASETELAALTTNDLIAVKNNAEIIGFYADEKNNRIFYFVTDFPFNTTTIINNINYTNQTSSIPTGLVGEINNNGEPIGPSMADDSNFCAIYVVEIGTENITKKIVSGKFLNFHKDFLITGVNLIDDLLFFTDGFNQPRKINVRKALQDNTYYDSEDKISVAKFAPFFAPQLLNYNEQNPPEGILDANTLMLVQNQSGLTSDGTIANDVNGDFLKEKFVQFSYRFKFADGEFSTIAPFTQACFIPETTELTTAIQKQIFKKGKPYFQDESTGDSKGMVNSINSIKMFIRMPSSTPNKDFNITDIEILYRESNNNLIRSVETLSLPDTTFKSQVMTPEETGSDALNFFRNYLEYTYKSTLPYKTLPERETTRVYDNVPLNAKAQEIVGSRVVYGNFVQDRELPIRNNITGLDFVASSSAKFDTTTYLHTEYSFHSIKQKRNYEVGVVLSDKYGRQSPVLTSTTKAGNVFVEGKSSTFNASSWDNGTVINDTTPGNASFCGDALNITFNEPIPDTYAQGTQIDIPEDVLVMISGNQLTAENINTGSGVFLTDNFSVGDFIKGRYRDFVKVTGVSTVRLVCDDVIAHDAIKGGQQKIIFKYKISPYGWYSYRIVVKQQEQDYYNVYTPGVFNFQETSEEKSYFPILGDSINKVTRDKEFANEQEKGLSTSKTRLFPKVISLGTSSDQVQSNSGIIDVISVGTAKEQSLVNKNGHVYNFIFEPEKNHLLAQIPYVSETKSFGIDKANTAIHTFTLPANERFEVTNDSMKQIDDNDASITFAASSNTADTATKIVVGDFLRGADKDLVKVTAISSPKITADGNIDVETYEGVSTKSINSTLNIGTSSATKKTAYDFPVFNYIPGDTLHVFETEPFESALDIYYETATSGYIHELNEDIAVYNSPNKISFSDTTNTFTEGKDYTKSTPTKIANINIGSSLGDTFNSLTHDLVLNKAEAVKDENQPEIVTNDFQVTKDTSNLYILQCTKNFVYSGVTTGSFVFKFKFTVTDKNTNESFTDTAVANLTNEGPLIVLSGSTNVFDLEDAGVGDTITILDANNGAAPISKEGIGFYFRAGNVNTGAIQNVDDTGSVKINHETGELVLEKVFLGDLDLIVFICDNVINFDLEGIDSALNNGGKEITEQIVINNKGYSIFTIPEENFAENDNDVANASKHWYNEVTNTVPNLGLINQRTKNGNTITDKGKGITFAAYSFPDRQGTRTNNITSSSGNFSIDLDNLTNELPTINKIINPSNTTCIQKSGQSPQTANIPIAVMLISANNMSQNHYKYDDKLFGFALLPGEGGNANIENNFLKIDIDGEYLCKSGLSGTAGDQTTNNSPYVYDNFISTFKNADATKHGVKNLRELGGDIHLFSEQYNDKNGNSVGGFDITSNTAKTKKKAMPSFAWNDTISVATHGGSEASGTGAILAYNDAGSISNYLPRPSSGVLGDNDTQTHLLHETPIIIYKNKDSNGIISWSRDQAAEGIAYRLYFESSRGQGSDAIKFNVPNVHLVRLNPNL